MSFTEKLQTRNFPLWLIPAALYLIACVVELIAVLKLNGNKFIYSLDDPYIHLALSENIARGHFGVNAQEWSAPSSSIIWPFLLTPFAGFSWFEFVPLVLNIFFSVLTIVIIHRSLEDIFKKFSLEGRGWKFFTILLMISLIFCLNLIALTFMGMEHTLQVLCTVAIIAGVINENETGKFPGFAVAALILAPIVRYENAALSGCVILLLFYRKHFKTAFISAAIIAIVLIGFSLFLSSLDLGFVPTSITVKSRTAWQSNKIAAIFKIIYANVSSRNGAVLLGLLAFLLKPAFTRTRIQLPALIVVAALVFHISLGDCTSGRYTNYITAAAILILLYSYTEPLRNFLLKSSFLLKTSVLATLTIFIASTFIADAILTPIASNNIYEQQYQMGRFVREYFRQPVAVNDLGLVSFKNNSYVLDLWGLASKPAFIVRMKERQGMDAGDWMNQFADQNNVKLAIIYPDWFPRIPENWERIAELRLGKLRVSAAESSVSFYSLDTSTKSSVIEKLQSFKSTLPPGVQMEIVE